MESPFEYNKPVFGSCFIGRTEEVKVVSNLIRERNNVLIYGQARIGKKSLILNSLQKLKQESYAYVIANVDLFNIRCVEAMLLKYTNEVLNSFNLSITEWNNILRKHVPSAPYSVFEISPNKPKITYTTKTPLTDKQIEEILALPEILATFYDLHLIIYLEQFQDILLFDDPRRVFKLLEKMWQERTKTSFIITGERINGMNSIFEEKKYFYKFAERVQITPIDEKIFSDFIIKGFIKTGKVINPEFATQIYTIVEGDPWYAQHLASICHEMTKGYVTDKILEEGIWCLINMHDFQFHSITFNLTKHQLRFIKAILEGVTKFSSADILDEYNLNSSANVNRVKEALMRKEIITFNKQKEAMFMDALFKRWLVKYFFIK